MMKINTRHCALVILVSAVLGMAGCTDYYSGYPMAPARITAEAQWWSPLAIDLTIAVPDTGPAARITSGDRGTGCGGTDKRSGDAATTSCEDINWATGERRLSSRRGDLEIAFA
jgi:hypothetical protein